MKLLVVKTGDTLPNIKERCGDFDAMFLENIGELGVEARIVEVHKGEALPRLEEIDAAIITGSPASVTKRDKWANELAAWTRDAVQANLHILGVCYGHQLLAHAMDGVVEKNPNGYEAGTISVQINDEGLVDPLLGAVARGVQTISFHSTHEDAVVELPPGARLLASTETTPVQAFAIGEHAWGVQFHPEFSEEVMKLYVQGRTAVIKANAERRGKDPDIEARRVADSVRPTPHGPLFLRRFITELHPPASHRRVERP